MLMHRGVSILKNYYLIIFPRHITAYIRNAHLLIRKPEFINRALGHAGWWSIIEILPEQRNTRIAQRDGLIEHFSSCIGELIYLDDHAFYNIFIGIGFEKLDSGLSIILGDGQGRLRITATAGACFELVARQLDTVLEFGRHALVPDDTPGQLHFHIYFLRRQMRSPQEQGSGQGRCHIGLSHKLAFSHQGNSFSRRRKAGKDTPQFIILNS